MKVALVFREKPIPEFVLSQFAEHGIELVEQICETGDQVLQLAADADIVWVKGGTRVLSEEVLRQLPKCQAILRTGAGTDNVPVAEATKLGIVVGNTPEAVMGSVAEHTIGLLLAVSRKISIQDRLTHQGHWDPFGEIASIDCPLLKDATLGLISFGRIAQQVTRKLSGFEMKILAMDPVVDAAAMQALGVEAASMDDLLKRSDYVSVHTPLMAETRHLISERELRLMKPHAVLINTSRGPVVDEAALIRALQEGWIGGAGVDVLETEPPAPDNPLRQMDNVVITPHISSYHCNCWHDFWLHSVSTIIEMAKGNAPLWQVNPQVTPRWLAPA